MLFQDNEVSLGHAGSVTCLCIAFLPVPSEPQQCTKTQAFHGGGVRTENCISCDSMLKN